MSTGPEEKPIVWLVEGVKTPPFTREGRLSVRLPLRGIHDGDAFGMPRSRPMPSVEPGVAELRVEDGNRSWRIFYRADEDAVVILGVFEMRTQKTPRRVVDLRRRRMVRHDALG